jgi:hypothetical protein
MMRQLILPVGRSDREQAMRGREFGWVKSRAGAGFDITGECKVEKRCRIWFRVTRVFSRTGWVIGD